MGIHQTPAWQALAEHARQMQRVHLRQLFAEDPDRFIRFHRRIPGLLVDFSKNWITDRTLALLVDLAVAAELPARRDAMLRGERINSTEKRAVLHTALRRPRGASLLLDGRDVVADVHAVLDQMERWVEAVRSGAWRGYTDRPITDVVNIGIGGSDLGPRMAVHALGAYAAKHLRFHFVSNIDPTHMARVLDAVHPETTVFLVASKTFTTQETLANAHAARAWFLRSATEVDIARHFVAMSTNTEAVRAFGIDPANMFGFWDWVGGRYSVWSAIGLSVALAIGMEGFREFLAGGHDMDTHFATTPLADNIPVILGLLRVWYRDFCGLSSCAVLPYDQYLEHFPSYLQQLDMESNGKGVTHAGVPVEYATGPVLWGQVGTNGQHAFYQLLHQGTGVVPCDFLAPREPLHPLGDQHRMLLANFLAQTEALMRGRTLEEARQALRHLPEAERERLAPHKVFPGNRPSTSIVYDRLTPRTLGRLIALYEHMVFVQGVIWDINSFDQMGVELGKELAGALLPELVPGAAVGDHDASTAALVRYLRAEDDTPAGD
ncbi:MAG: glucose-6-phosphate isomerase [Desulfomicrobiaceae bacterium]|nr:glucose-6-phosphate isomerase [Desulfomicrobiaceae bacterium]